MNVLIRQFADYLEESLGITPKLERWSGCRSLPVFMQTQYDCWTTWILDAHCLLLVSHDDTNTPAAIRKHAALAGKKWHGTVVFVSNVLASYDRRRLIQYKVPFVIPGNQLYLPDIALDLREHFRSVRTDRKPFSPSTQIVVLRALEQRDYGPFTSAQLAHKLHYTPMTAKRSIDEIEVSELGSVRMRGRERELRFEKTGRELWEAALPFLRDPVQRRVTATFPPDSVAGLEAGLTALSRYSMISAPMPPTLAISSEAWKTARQDPWVHETAYEDEGAHRLEIWRYSPALLSVGPTVDKLSLFLSLRDAGDERVEAALDEMMENLQW